MKPFRHLNALSIAEAVHHLNDYAGRARIVAGGTDILGILKDQILPDYPEALVNIKTIPGLDYIAEDSSGLKIGALAKLDTLARSPLLRGKYKLLAEAAQSVATPQIRNMGTIGGNLSQDTRCWYYRYPHAIGGRIMCMRKGSGPCLAVNGDNRYHAIFGGRRCFAACPSDLATALLTLEAEIVTEGTGGSRIIPVKDFFNPLGNALEKDELIVEIRMPKPPAEAQQHFIKYTLRKPVDFAVVSVAALVTLKEGVCTEERISLGAVAPGPIRAEEAEQFIKGKKPGPATLQEAAALAVQTAKPLSKNGYKIEIAQALIARALAACIAQPPASTG
jgi:xanthine dehydrogenase YagS FAD-binding subunit